MEDRLQPKTAPQCTREPYTAGVLEAPAGYSGQAARTGRTAFMSGPVFGDRSPRHMKPFAGPNDGEFASTDPMQVWTQIEIGANTLALGRWHVDTTPQGQSDCIAHVSIAGVGSRTRPNDPPGSSGGPSD